MQLARPRLFHRVGSPGKDASDDEFQYEVVLRQSVGRAVFLLVAVGTLQFASAGDVFEAGLAEGVAAVQPERLVGGFVEAEHADGAAEVLRHLYR